MLLTPLPSAPPPADCKHSCPSAPGRLGKGVSGAPHRFLAPPLFHPPEILVAEPALEKATLFDSQDFSILLVNYKMAWTLVIGLEKQKDQPTSSKVPPKLSLSMSCLGELIKSMEGGPVAPAAFSQGRGAPTWVSHPLKVLPMWRSPQKVHSVLLCPLCRWAEQHGCPLSLRTSFLCFLWAFICQVDCHPHPGEAQPVGGCSGGGQRSLSGTMRGKWRLPSKSRVHGRASPTGWQRVTKLLCR